MTDPKQRFSDRVADYIKYRPKYPKEIIPILKEAIGLTPAGTVADIGAGTGFLTELFLANGNKTYAIEPNQAMREAATDLYGHYPNLEVINGSAEATTLADYSMDITIAAQAFHWFDQDVTKKEFDRILKPGGHIVLIWNARKDDIAFSKGYDDILTSYLPEYSTLDHRNVDDHAIEQFFSPQKMGKAILPNEQVFDKPGFTGRVLSSSYVPKSGAVHEKIMQEIEALFDRYQQGGQVSFKYDTLIYWTQ